MGSSAGKHDAGRPRGKTSVKALVQFVKDPTSVMTDCRDRYGAVFLTGSSVFQQVVGLVGPEALQQFEENVENGNMTRKGAFPPGIYNMVGNILPTYDEPEHGINRAAILEALTPELLKTYIPAIRTILEREYTNLLALKGVEFSWVKICERTIFAAAMAVILGVTDDCETQRLNIDEWSNMMPTSAMKAESKGLDAKTRVQAFVHTTVLEAKKRVAVGKARACVLDNILLFKKLPEAYLELECWHMVLAGCALLPTAAIATMTSCLLDPKLWQQAVEEMGKLAEEVKDPWDNIGAETMPFITSLILEVKRFYVLGPTTVPALVKRNFVIKTKEGNFDVPKGALCVAGLEATCKFASTWEDPHTFNPSRFKDFNLSEGDNRFRFCPQSFGTNRRCPGENLTTLFLQCFVLSLSPYVWQMTKGQDYTLEKNSIAPKPVGGLMASGFELRPKSVTTTEAVQESGVIAEAVKESGVNAAVQEPGAVVGEA